MNERWMKRSREEQGGLLNFQLVEYKTFETWIYREKKNLFLDCVLQNVQASDMFCTCFTNIIFLYFKR